MGGVQGATDNPKPSLQTAAERNPDQLQHKVRPVFELGYR
jgi:hypothetical protein